MAKHVHRRQRSPVYVLLLLFELTLLLLQLWLFASALEGILAHQPGMAVPGALISVACLGAILWMLSGVNKTDRED